MWGCCPVASKRKEESDMKKQVRIKKAESTEALIRELDHAQNRVVNIHSELVNRGVVEHEFHSPVMNTIFTEITPAIASKMLKHYNSNTGVDATNRSMSKTAMEKISKDMRQGEFYGNVSTAYFDDEGLLMDGQTRLQAILNSKTPQHMHVTMGVPRKGMIKMDIGRKRSNADRFRLSGKFGRVTNTQAMWYEKLARYSLYANMSIASGKRPYHSTTMVITDTEIEDELNRLADPIQYIADNRSKKKGLTQLPLLCAIANWWAEYDSDGDSQADDAKQFYDDLLAGDRLSQGDPLYTLREKMLTVDWSRMDVSQKEGYALCWGWTMHAINKHTNAEVLTRLAKNTISYKIKLP